MTPQIRILNIDWLEIHCLEPRVQDVDFFYANGWEVMPRSYGTRVYNQMFSIGKKGKLMYEIRREPASSGLNGIFRPEECHIRVKNAELYTDNCVERFMNFLQEFSYTVLRVSRVDLALDFVQFDSGDMPAKFIKRYLQGVYSKLNSTHIAAHGTDTWNGQVWNSLSWGMPRSPIRTRLYNKTLELYDAQARTFKKQYILQRWQMAGLIDDVRTCTLSHNLQSVYRLEFQINSSVKRWVTINPNGKANQHYSLPNTLEIYKEPGGCLVIFASLVRHYFRFKFYSETQRKDRCPDKELFDFKGVQNLLKPTVNEQDAQQQSYQKPFQRLVRDLLNYRLTISTEELHKAVNAILKDIRGKDEYTEYPFMNNDRQFEQITNGLLEALKRRGVLVGVDTQCAADSIGVRHLQIFD